MYVLILIVIFARRLFRSELRVSAVPDAACALRAHAGERVRHQPARRHELLHAAGDDGPRGAGRILPEEGAVGAGPAR